MQNTDGVRPPAGHRCTWSFSSCRSLCLRALPSTALALLLGQALSSSGAQSPWPAPPPQGYPAHASAQIPRMVDPAIDDDHQPFSYASRSTDQLSVVHAPSGAEITPEGDLYTGFGELDFFVGLDRAPVHERIRTLKDGYLPVFSYSVNHDGLTYKFTFFASPVTPPGAGATREPNRGQTSEQAADEIIVNFVRVTVLNPGPTPRRGYLTTAWRYQGEQTTSFPTGDDRFRRPIPSQGTGGFHQPGEPFRADSHYSVDHNAMLRDGQVLYLFPSDPAPQLSGTYRDYYNRSTPSDLAPTVQPTTPMATAEYALTLGPHAQRTLDFKVPLLPATPAAPAFAAINQASFDEREQALATFWHAIFASGIEITTPEAKVNDTYRASLVYDLSALNKVDGQYIQTINQFQYHRFYLRDSADFVRMYDTSGYPDIGRQVIDFFATRQQPDGNFLSQPGQYDGWGEALWTYGEHYRITHDKAFAAEVYPRIVRAVGWLEQALAADPLHLVPATDVRDNEYIAGHLTGYNFLALDGLQAAERLAHDLGHADDEAHDKSIEAGLRASLMTQLAHVTATTGGYMPPALDGDLGGTDWGNLLSLTPEQQLQPDDPRVTATLRHAQARYQEGLMTYTQPDEGTYLHHYLTIKNTLTELIRNEQQQAIREFYAELLHTSSTHAGWEYSIRPWGDRDFSGNLSPHGWFAADFRNLLRNMMLREEGPDLHLLSALSPEWIRPGQSIDVNRAMTYFGTYGFDLQVTSPTAATLTLHPAFAPGHAPARLLVHLPWFLQVTSIHVEGKPVPIPASGVVALAPDVRRVDFRWHKRLLPADMPASYSDAVGRYKREYRTRFQQLN